MQRNEERSGWGKPVKQRHGLFRRVRTQGDAQPVLSQAEEYGRKSASVDESRLSSRSCAGPVNETRISHLSAGRVRRAKRGASLSGQRT